MKAALILLLLSFSAWGQIEVVPKNSAAMVFPGDLVEAHVKILDESLINKLTPALWRKQGDPKNFLVMSTSAVQKDGNGWHLESKIVLGPEFQPDKQYQFKIDEQSFGMSFRGWLWNPQSKQLAPDYVYEIVPFFSRQWWEKHWVLSLVLLVLALAGLGFAGWTIYSKHSRKQRVLRERENWKREVADSQSLLQLSKLWLKRDDLKRMFPSTEQAQREFFDLLNRSQFKPRIDDDELKILLRAKDNLLTQLQGEKHGI